LRPFRKAPIKVEKSMPTATHCRQGKKSTIVVGGEGKNLKKEQKEFRMKWYGRTTRAGKPTGWPKKWEVGVKRVGKKKRGTRKRIRGAQCGKCNKKKPNFFT